MLCLQSGKNLMLPFFLSLISIFRISRIAIGRPHGVRILSVLLASSTTLLVLIATEPNGIALTPDSVGYISAARNLSIGKGLTLYDSSPLTIQAPLYPALLALLELFTELDPLEGARFINAGLYGLIVYHSGLLLRRRLVHSSSVVVGLGAVSLSPVLFSVSAYALTEPLFILWTIVFLLLLDNYLNERSLALLLPLALVTGLACLTRYLGISCAVSGAAALLFLHRIPFRSRLYHFTLYGAISGALLGAWAARNFLLASTFLGDRDPSPYPLYQNLYFALVRYLSWFFPLDYFADNLRSTKAHFVLGAITGYIVGFAWSPRNLWTDLRPALFKIGPELLFAGIYSTLLVVVSTVTAHEGINDRYMSPVYVPAIVIFLYCFEKRLAGPATDFSFRLFSFTGKVATRPWANALLITWLAILSLRTVHTATQLMQTGLGYNHTSWRTSETISYFREKILSHSDEIVIFSNSPDAVYIFSGAPVSSSPEATGYKSSEPRRPVASIAGTWPSSQTAFLIWFNDIERDHLFKVHELEQVADLSVVKALPDGTIYMVSTK